MLELGGDSTLIGVEEGREGKGGIMQSPGGEGQGSAGYASSGMAQENLAPPGPN